MIEQIENHMVIGDEPEPQKVCECACCGYEILEGDYIYDFGGEIIHEDCLNDWADAYRDVAEKEDE